MRYDMISSVCPPSCYIRQDWSIQREKSSELRVGPPRRQWWARTRCWMVPRMLWGRLCQCVLQQRWLCRTPGNTIKHHVTVRHISTAILQHLSLHTPRMEPWSPQQILSRHLSWGKWGPCQTSYQVEQPSARSRHRSVIIFNNTASSWRAGIVVLNNENIIICWVWKRSILET